MKANLSRTKVAFATVGLGLLAMTMLPITASAADVDQWPAIHSTVFNNKPIIKNDGVVALDVPVQVQDAALVPITVRIPGNMKDKVKKLTLVIDKNPMPIVATFKFGPAAGSGYEQRISTRVRIDDFSNIRAIAETADGKLHMATGFIAGAGGCAAMNASDPLALLKGMGRMQVKVFEPALDETPTAEGEIMLKHPNFSGMEINPNTGNFIPARFVNHIVVKRGNQLVFDMTAGSSISSNPHFRFTFLRGKTDNLNVKITDTKDTVFSGHSAPSS